MPVWWCGSAGSSLGTLHTGKEERYSENQSEHMVQEEAFMLSFGKWVKDFEDFVRQKGKVQPGRYRAFGYQKPNNLIKELQTGIRSWKLRFGWPPRRFFSLVPATLRSE
jgi:hypothetical protein